MSQRLVSDYFEYCASKYEQLNCQVWSLQTVDKSLF